MRSFVLFLATLSFSLFAFTNTYSGEGNWKSNDGHSGEYTVVAVIQASGDDRIEIAQTLNLEGRTLSSSIYLQKIDDTFYNVVDANDNVIGSGYCWSLEPTDNKICHSYAHVDNHVVESTIKKLDNDLYRIGSKIDLKSGQTITWQDHMQKQE